MKKQKQNRQKKNARTHTTTTTTKIISLWFEKHIYFLCVIITKSELFLMSAPAGSQLLVKPNWQFVEMIQSVFENITQNQNVYCFINFFFCSSSIPLILAVLFQKRSWKSRKKMHSNNKWTHQYQDIWRFCQKPSSHLFEKWCKHLEKLHLFVMRYMFIICYWYRSHIQTFTRIIRRRNRKGKPNCILFWQYSCVFTHKQFSFHQTSRKRSTEQ